VTEAGWNRCTDPGAMLDFLRSSGRVTDRKLRLLAVACCRQAWHRLPKAESRHAVELAEAAADDRRLMHGLR
jgi:hypothetical protein